MERPTGRIFLVLRRKVTGEQTIKFHKVLEGIHLMSYLQGKRCGEKQQSLYITGNSFVSDAEYMKFLKCLYIYFKREYTGKQENRLLEFALEAKLDDILRKLLKMMTRLLCEVQ